ncbi:MAG TPA: hypothetical protein VGQ76_22755 [Thermoanaerobaculia bacterium]|jgi:hypothetical protein|nr:hypothetical protein [Thermoanaerobaculia bacterium]
MPCVVLTFLGICTHINEVSLQPPEDALSPAMLDHDGTFTRVVLPDASLGYRWSDDHEIPPHHALLRIRKEFIASDPGPLPGLEEIESEDHPNARVWRMQGVQLYVRGATQNLSVTRDEYRTLPSLGEFADTQLELDPRVVYHGRAAAVVDLYGGIRDAYCDPNSKEAVHGTFSVNTDSQTLVVVRIRDGATSQIDLKDSPELGPPTVHVMNTGRDKDDPRDFFLHYYCTTWTPTSNAHVPGKQCKSRLATELEKMHHEDLPGGLTFGCSNSAYP